MGSIISGIGSFIGGQTASRYDKSASDTAKQAYSYARSDLSPYNTAGQSAISSALSLAQGSPTGGGTDYVTQASQNLPASSGAMTESELQKTPGYQFTLDQGLKSTQAANAAKGLGVSGAALKGAATYATGLADSTYANRFNEAQQSFSDYLNLNTAQQSNLTNQFNRLKDVSSIGETAASNLATAGTNAANTSATALTNAGTALSSGTQGLATGLGNALNQYIGYNYNGGTSGYGGDGGTYYNNSNYLSQDTSF